MEKGRIIKLIGGIYTVMDESGQTHTLRPRGVFRHTKENPKVGDWVSFENTIINKLHPRNTDLVRPPIANIDQALLISSLKRPDFSFYLLDRFLLLVNSKGIDPIIVVNKTDLVEEARLEELKATLNYYDQYFPVYYVSAKVERTVETLKEVFADRLTVLAGQSGAGKSALLNAMNTDFALKEGETSKALGRGRHTTRHVELHRLEGGLVADTPGFSKLDFSDFEVWDIPHFYPDFFDRSSMCKFNECQHLKEPGCAIKKAVDAGEIPRSRYDNYVKIYEEIETQTKW